MVESDILEIIGKIEIETKKYISGPLSGDYKNKLKGSGFEFEQLRDYQPGDDIRYIDWKSSARTDKILVKQYLEDKNRDVYILVDISGSTYFGTKDLKINLIKKLASILAFASLHNKDSVGLVFFSDKIEFISPAKADRAHIIWALKNLFEFKASSKKSDFSTVLKDFLKLLAKKRSIICLVSDFAFDLDVNLLRSVSINHDLIAFRCLDDIENKFVDAGIIKFEDVETGQDLLINTSDYDLNENLKKWNLNQKVLLNSSKIDCFDAVVQVDFFKNLVGFLSQRIRY